MAEAAVVKDDIKEITSKDYYFDSYSHFGIHEEMLKDSVRTSTYMKAIVNNKHLFKDKVVLDVGCGTGILCMFAAKAGAKKVIGIEMAGIINQAREIVKDNGFEDVITLVKGKVEEVELPVDKVDIIISEWMGYFLLYESMLDTVIFARDKWLVKDGIIMPDRASIFLCGIEDEEYRHDKIDYWDSVYGFKMSCIKKLALVEPLVDMCEARQVISSPSRVLDIDIYTVKKEDLDFKADFKLTFTHDNYCHAIVGYFTVEFSKTHTQLKFSTGPKDKYTHWKQTVFYLEDPIVAAANEVLVGNISVNRHAGNPRDLDITINCTTSKGEAKSQSYRLR